MLNDRIETTVVPRKPLDVLAQQIVAMCALDEWEVEKLGRVVRRAYPYSDLGPRAFDSVLDMLSGRYPSDQFVELRPRLVWDRVAGQVRGRAWAQRLAVTNPGTIPDRGLYSVNLAEDGRRVGELDEEMVYETRVGETFVLGASTWRIVEITPSQVIVNPAPGEPGKIAFWKADAPSRPVELGAALGKMVRELRALPREAAATRLRERAGFDDLAVKNLLAYLDDQAQATARTAHPAMAAADAQRGSAPGRGPVPRFSDPGRDVARGHERSLRHARAGVSPALHPLARDPCRRRRYRARLAVRVVAVVLLRCRVHVRGRPAAG